jgi:RNA polymerase sigma-70 factor (ECF subfamily)
MLDRAMTFGRGRDQYLHVILRRSPEEGVMNPESSTATDAEFGRLADPFRRELLVHCYRMLGSVDEAEDLVQETMLRAWRGYAGFTGASSLRTWLYRIATNVCLRAIENGARRPLPSGLGAPSEQPELPVTRSPEIPWLQPIPDALLGGEDDPATIVTSRESTRLAFVAALQQLPAKQRAVLILRDVLAWQASEVAQLLDTSTAAVNSALQRARAQLAAQTPAADTLTEPTEAAERELLDRYVTAFQNADVAGLVQLLRDDAILEMPPAMAWFLGTAAIERFLRPRVGSSAHLLSPTAANGQPAVAVYRAHDDGMMHAHGIHVLEVRGAQIARITAFLDTSGFARFDLPLIWPVSGSR